MSWRWMVSIECLTLYAGVVAAGCTTECHTDVEHVDWAHWSACFCWGWNLERCIEAGKPNTQGRGLQNDDSVVIYTVSPKNSVSNFLQYLHQLLTDFENSFTVGNSNELAANKYTFRRLLKILQYCLVKHGSFEECCNCSTIPWWQSCHLHQFFKILLKLKENILLCLLIYCPVQQNVYQSLVHDVEELLDIWHGLQQSAVDGNWWKACLRTCVWAKGGHFELWQYANWVSGHWNSETMFQIRRMCFSNWLTINKVIIEVWHSFHQELVEHLQHF